MLCASSLRSQRPARLVPTLRTQMLPSRQLLTAVKLSCLTCSECTVCVAELFPLASHGLHAVIAYFLVKSSHEKLTRRTANAWTALSRRWKSAGWPGLHSPHVTVPNQSLDCYQVSTPTLQEDKLISCQYKITHHLSRLYPPAGS